MGSSRSVAELARKLDTLSTEIKGGQPRASRAGADIIARSVKSEMRSATGGDFVLSGMTKTTGVKNRRGNAANRGKIGVRVQRGQVDKSAHFVAATGPAHIAESDQDPHVVTSRWAKGADYTKVTKAGKTVKGRSTRKSRQATVLTGNALVGGGRRAVLNLGGGRYLRWTVAKSKGRHPWKKGVRASKSRAVLEMRKVEAAAVMKVFR